MERKKSPGREFRFSAGREKDVVERERESEGRGIG